MKNTFLKKILAISVVIFLCSCKEDKPDTTPTVDSVIVSPETAEIVKGEQQIFTATVIGTNNPAQTVIWSILGTGHKEATTIDSNGTLTIAATENLKSITVRATSSVSRSKNGTAVVTIIDPDLPSDPLDLTAAQIVSKIRVGWNLGNTLDAAGDKNGFNWLGGGVYANTSVAQMETAWLGGVNRVTTKANFDALKNAGFNAVRIPVTWFKALDENNIIREDWMARVKEIVDYAVANDMYILLNTHHDEEIFKFSNNGLEESLNVFRKVWEQIAVAFKDYNEKLIFEALNEPRTKGTPGEWTGGTAVERNNLNAHYRVFVETVRATGGNNDRRVLMINTYAASATASAVNGLVIPDDVVSNKIIVSIHTYAPYNFALNVNSPINTWNSNNSSDTNDINSAINLAYNTFVSKGIPVILGEFGALNKNNTAARAAWAEYYVKTAKSKEMPCFWWDNAGVTGSGELFGLLNRQTNVFHFPEIVEALMKGTE